MELGMVMDIMTMMMMNDDYDYAGDIEIRKAMSGSVQKVLL